MHGLWEPGDTWHRQGPVAGNARVLLLMPRTFWGDAEA